MNHLSQNFLILQHTVSANSSRVLSINHSAQLPITMIKIFAQSVAMGMQNEAEWHQHSSLKDVVDFFDSFYDLKYMKASEQREEENTRQNMVCFNKYAVIGFLIEYAEQKAARTTRIINQYIQMGNEKQQDTCKEDSLN